ncbi:hypothetical protein [Reyranella sp. CPCC 100927]|nr:hypothetical protein [Reyranella sp. CPCC 100927]
MDVQRWASAAALTVVTARLSGQVETTGVSRDLPSIREAADTSL